MYIHWGTEYTTCPNADQQQLAATLAQAGATAVIGTHAHVLQGAGWRSDGVFVAYGLGNYLWWRSFGNNQDDNGVLTLTFRRDHVVADKFHPSHLDDRGVPMPATGAEYNQIMQEWRPRTEPARGLSASPPKSEALDHEETGVRLRVRGQATRRSPTTRSSRRRRR